MRGAASGEHLFFHYYLAFKVKFTFMPVGTVRQVVFSRSRTYSQQLGGCFVVCSPFISTGFRRFPLWIRHIYNYLFELL